MIHRPPGLNSGAANWAWQAGNEEPASASLWSLLFALLVVPIVPLVATLLGKHLGWRLGDLLFAGGFGFFSAVTILLAVSVYNEYQLEIARRTAQQVFYRALFENACIEGGRVHVTAEDVAGEIHAIFKVRALGDQSRWYPRKCRPWSLGQALTR